MSTFDLTKTSDETLRSLEALTYMDRLLSEDQSSKSAANHLEVKRELYRRGLQPRIKPTFPDDPTEPSP